jgi:hypothetical protein
MAASGWIDMERRRNGAQAIEGSVVGPWGLEPQTSTVSICRPHDYRLLLKATNLMFLKEMTSLLSPP